MARKSIHASSEGFGNIRWPVVGWERANGKIRVRSRSHRDWKRVLVVLRWFGDKARPVQLPRSPHTTVWLFVHRKTMSQYGSKPRATTFTATSHSPTQGSPFNGYTSVISAAPSSIGYYYAARYRCFRSAHLILERVAGDWVDTDVVGYLGLDGLSLGRMNGDSNKLYVNGRGYKRRM